MGKSLCYIVVVASFALLVAGDAFKVGNGWKWWCVGECSFTSFSAGERKPAQNPSSLGAVLMGGGTDVDEAFKWMIRRSTPAPVVTILRAAGTDAYNNYIYQLGNCTAVSTFLMENSSASSDSFVLNLIQQSDVIWFAGGDQGVYVGPPDLWYNTAIQKVLQQKVALSSQRSFTIGGTSAGMALLGYYIYTGANGSAISSDALQNPYGDTITIVETGPFVKLPMIKQLVTDTHFFQRDRMGRIITFMARLLKDKSLPYVRGIACDEQSAVLIESQTNTAAVVTQASGNEHVCYFIEAQPSKNDTIEPNMPVTLGREVHVWRIANGDGFDLNNWTATDGHFYHIRVQNGTLVGNIY